MEKCEHCGDSIRFIRVGNGARWSSSRSIRCTDSPTGSHKVKMTKWVPMDENHDLVWDRYTMSYVHVK